MAKVTYFNNYDTDFYEEMAKEILVEPSETEIQNAIWHYMHDDWDDMMMLMAKVFEGHPLIVSGEIGRWNGKSTGGQIYMDWWKFISDFGKDCEYFEVYMEKGHLYVRCSRHDGNNFCEVKAITDAGDRYYDNWNYDTDPRLSKYHEAEILSRMFHNSKYTRCPKIELFRDEQ